MLTKRSLGRKILYAMMALVIGLLLLAGTILAVTMGKAAAVVETSGRSLTETIGKQSSEYMTGMSQDRMLELAGQKAEIADEFFLEFEHGVRAVATVAEHIYDHPELYSPRSVPLPDASRDGELTLQVLYSAHADPSDPEIVRELELLGNVQDVLLAVNDSQDNMVSLYVATESGFMVQADYIPAKKYDDSGNLMPLEARERPWYEGAKETGKPFFTPVTKDAHTPRLAIMCGVPVFSGGRLMGVAGAGMYLDNMESLVRSVDLGEGGYACILNRRGQVLFSTYDEGTLAAVADAQDLRLSGDAALSEMAENAVSGGKGITLVTLDGTAYYAAYAPMRTVGWSMVVFLARDAVEAPTNTLLDSIDATTEKAFREYDGTMYNARALLIMLLVTAMLVAVIVSAALSRQIVKPIRLLTDKVTDMHGDNLDFHWDLDTDEETETLAASFESLTERLKEYIRESEAITAEKERISTEMSLARRIQSSMLPSVFPPYPDRSEFDIYASMEPAREVGGDFYDFFLTDEDHLGLVIADVSGKGVPGALFMMISKIILQSCAMMGQSPAEILTRTNEAICANNEEEMFVTAWVGILDLRTGELTAANAGHEYPVFKAPDGPFELLKDRHGFVMGGIGGMEYREYSVRLQPGSKLFLYTDGVPEAMGGETSQEMFGTGRMLAALNEDPGLSPKQLLQRVRAAVGEHAGNTEQFDDITMLCIEYRGND